MKIFYIIIIALLVISTSAGAQDKAKVSVGADVVSTYVWRGVYQSGFSIQPSLGIGYKGIYLGAWGSTDLENSKEIDLSIKYSICNLSLSITDYWWSGQKNQIGEFNRYFNYKQSHFFEGTVAYTFSEKLPLTASWSTIFAGEDKKENNNRAYSSYVELSYPFSVQSIDLMAAVGAAPWSAPSWLLTTNSGFQVSNISLKASKSISVSENYSIPVFTQLAVNPAADYVNFIVGVSF